MTSSAGRSGTENLSSESFLSSCPIQKRLCRTSLLRFFVLKNPVNPVQKKRITAAPEAIHPIASTLQSQDWHIAVDKIKARAHKWPGHANSRCPSHAARLLRSLLLPSARSSPQSSSHYPAFPF